MSTQDTSSIRQQVQSTPIEEFVKGTSKADLKEMAAIVNVGDDIVAKGTKQELGEAIYAKFPAPPVKPEILRQSKVNHPVAKVWLGAENMVREAEAAGKDKPRRSVVCDTLVQNGIAYHTARTQYQAWYKATDGGRVPLTQLTGLPKSVREALDELAEANG